MKKILLTFLLTFALVLTPHFSHEAEAIGSSVNEIFEDFRGGVEEVSEDLEESGSKLVLPTYFTLNKPSEDGLTGIVAVIETFLDFVKLIVAPVALLFITVMGIRMVAAGSENEEVITKSKNYIIYSIQGLLVIFVSDTLIEVFFGPTGEVFRGGTGGVQTQGRQVSIFLEGLYSLVQTIIGVVAIFVLILAGMRYVGGSYSDDQIAGAKRMITWSLVGLFVVAISEFVVKRILFVDNGQQVNFDAARNLLTDFTGFVASTIGMLSFAALIYAGWLYVSARDNEDNVSKAKNIIAGAFIGILIALGAFALTNTIVTLDAS